MLTELPPAGMMRVLPEGTVVRLVEVWVAPAAEVVETVRAWPPVPALRAAPPLVCSCTVMTFPAPPHSHAVNVRADVVNARRLGATTASTWGEGLATPELLVTDTDGVPTVVSL